MSMPFTMQATLNAPPLPGQPSSVPLLASLSATYGSRVDYRLELTGSGNKTLNLGTIGPTGTKCLFITVDADPTPGVTPVLISLNSATPGIEISQGGFLVLGSPSPTSSGVLSVALSYSSNVAVNVWAFG